MKHIFILTVSTLYLCASMGNCLDCHPKLAKDIQNDKKHVVMKGCVECHTPNEKPTLECGDKCFSCHSKEDMDVEEIPQHKVFEECRECHEIKTQHIFNPTQNFEQSHRNSLQEFLF